MVLPISGGRVGHIIAVEGPAEVVSTQLRLLPVSRQVLILPSLQHYLRDTTPENSFAVRDLILQYHKAYQARHTEALEFLRPSTSGDETRLVFMHGGAMSAEVSCLSAIMDHEMHCDVEEAHATFIRLASNGVGRLSSARFSYQQTSDSPSRGTEQHEDPKPATENGEKGRGDALAGRRTDAGDDTMEDRIIRAMRAADALDKETEFLQPVTPDVDLTVKLVHIPSRAKKRLSSTVVEASETLRGSRPPFSRGAQAEPPAEPVARVSPSTSSAQGPAFAALRKPPLRIRIPSPPIPRAGDVAAGKDQQPPRASRPRHSAPERPHHRRSHTVESNLSPRQIPTNNDGTKVSFGLHSPMSQDAPLSREKSSRKPIHLGASQSTTTEEQPFESVLPLLEDLVVFLTPETPDELHDFVLRRLSDVCRAPRPSIPGLGMPEHDASRSASHMAMGEGHIGQMGLEHGYEKETMPYTREDLVHGLPTPNQSPNPLDAASAAVSPPNTRLYSISVAQETAVSIQNFLRSFLASQLPLQDRHSSTPNGSELPAQASLWRRLQCDGRVASPEGRSRLDLILAVGAESGVTKNRLSEVIGQLETLGFKTSGVSRSGRLDIRYVFVCLRPSNRER